MEKQSLGEYIRSFREACMLGNKKLTGEDLALMLSLNTGKRFKQQTISHWETDKRPIPIDMVRPLLWALTLHGGIARYEDVELWIERYIDKHKPVITPLLTFTRAEFEATRAQKAHIPAVFHDIPHYDDISLEHLVGIKKPLEDIEEALINPRIAVGIEGLGGSGKTSLTLFLARRVGLMGVFEGIYVVSVRQRYLSSHKLHDNKDKPASQSVTNQYEMVLKDLARQMGLIVPPEATPDDILLLIHAVYQHRHILIILDNLETQDDVNTFKHMVETFCANQTHSRLIIASRYSLSAYQPRIKQIIIKELGIDDALHLFHNHGRYLQRKDVAKIHAIIGGNPMALRLLTGIFDNLGIDEIVYSLKQTAQQTTQQDRRWEIFKHLYARILDFLQPDEIELFITIGTNYDTDIGVTFPFLCKDLGYATDQLITILQKLCLVHLLNFDQGQARYTMHRLTMYYIRQQFFGTPPP